MVPNVICAKKTKTTKNETAYQLFFVVIEAG